jgi:hypothetical protein
MGGVARESSHLVCGLITLVVVGIGFLIARFRD